MRLRFLASALTLLVAGPSFLAAPALGGRPTRSAFVPPPENEVPRGATRNAATRSAFVPPPENEAPSAAATSNAATRSAFIPPPENEAPSAATTSNAATRGERCLATDSTKLQALLPEPYNFGTTLQARPTLLVHLPQTEARQAFFSLKVADPGAEERTLYTAAVPLTADGGGILRWQLPADAPPLEVGRDYHWYLVLQCGDRIQTSDLYVDGWIRRIEPPTSLAASSETTDVAAAYGREGIWYDLVALMADRRLTGSEADSAEWVELLDSETVGLTGFGNAPFLQP